jgi:twinkle protein
LLVASADRGAQYLDSLANRAAAVIPGKLAVWAGWTHHGKTQMLKQVMLHAIRQSERPLIASMEEEVLEVWEDLGKMACGREDPTVREAKKFCEYVRGKLWLYDQQGRISPRKMVAVIRYAAAELKITQAVVDSLMMLAVDRDDYDAQARFVGDLKAAAKDTGVTVHLVAHMRKRDGKRRGRCSRDRSRHRGRTRNCFDGRLRLHPLAGQAAG